MSTKRFLGYDTDENGKLVINKKQVKIVERIYDEYLSGKTAEHIKRMFEKEGVKNWDDKSKWQASTIKSILKNEKYKGDAILQKTYTVDFLSKKRAKNKGYIQQYHIEENHDAIIDPLVWEAVQLEADRRQEYVKEHGLKAYATKPETNPFAGKIICGQCNKAYTRKTWKSGSETHKIWQCQDRYRVKGVEVCLNRNADENSIESACQRAIETILNRKDEYLKKWVILTEFGNPLEQYRVMKLTESIVHKPDDVFSDFSLIEEIKILGDGSIEVRLIDNLIVNNHKDCYE